MVSAKIAAICLAVAAVLMLSACAEANSLWYQEDFEGGSDPQPITAAPFNWLVPYGSSHEVSSATGMPTLALSGFGPFGTQNLHVKPLAGLIPAASPETCLELTADIYLHTSSHNTDISLTEFLPDPDFSASGKGVHLEITNGVWNLVGHRDTAKTDYFRIPFGAADFNEVVQASILLSTETGTVTATVSQSSGTISTQTSFPFSQINSLTALSVCQERRFGNSGFDVDNIQITGSGFVPEPMTMLGLSGGVLVLGGYVCRRRRIAAT